MEFLLQFFGEFLLQILAEALMELGFHGVRDTFRSQKNPILSTIGFLAWGALLGGLSLLVFPASFIASPALRWVNLFLTPLAIAATMHLVGKLREKNESPLVNLDRFGYALPLAFAMALVRFLFAT